MDNSSRTVVKFIATITAAALLFMAARFYADAQKGPQLPAPSETAAAPLDETPAPESATRRGRNGRSAANVAGGNSRDYGRTKRCYSGQ